jgi:NagD protein
MDLETLRNKTAFISDMDGVIYHGHHLLPGAMDFVRWLQQAGKKYLFLTNAAYRTREQTAEKLRKLGIETTPEHCYNSALATADFLAAQKPGGSAYVIGGDGLRRALADVGYSESDTDPDYVVVSETDDYDYASVTRAINLVRGGAKLIGANPDLFGPGQGGIVPGTGAIIKPIELAAQVTAYFVGKPNPLMMRDAIKHLSSRREETVIIGDRMETDILAGVESEIDTVLVLSGVTRREDLPRYPYQPDLILDNVGQIVG